MKKIYFKGLTEIRGIAALLVMISHVDQFGEVLNIHSINISQTGIAGFAVTIFFTLSGFLITYLLVQEQNRSGGIDLKKFYLRRVLRIWPAYYLTIFLSVLCMSIGFFNFPSINKLTISITGFLLMVPNLLCVLGLTLPATTPLWSIGVEEQFYLVWPWVIRKIKSLDKFLVIGISFYLVVKIFFYMTHPTGGAYLLVKLTQFDCMAIGSFLALNRKNNSFKFLFHPILQALSIIFLVSPFFISLNLFANLETEVYSIASAIWILNTAFNKNSHISLNSRILRFFGKLSYGIYVYHLLWIYIIGRLDLELNIWLTYLLVTTVSIAFAYLSYELIEKKFLSLKKRYSVIESRG